VLVSYRFEVSYLTDRSKHINQSIDFCKEVFEQGLGKFFRKVTKAFESGFFGKIAKK
jgi:hypothetical protein